MASERPELIFLAGPQQGRRAVLTGHTAIIGRSASAAVRIMEQYVSREQVRFTLASQGWVVENLSTRPMRINGKKYKRNKRILLATGDLIGLGMFTEILFVGPGDDPEEALSAFRATHVVPPLPARPELAETGPEAPAEAVPQGEAKEAQGEPMTRQLVATDEQRRKKYKKYAVMFGLYALGLILVVVWLSGWGGGSDGQSGFSGNPDVLTDDQIASALTKLLERPQEDKKAGEKLAQAKVYYHRESGPGDLYRCYKRFKEHRAFKSGVLDRATEEMYVEVQKKVIEKVQDQYRKAYFLEKQCNWPDARSAFDQLLEMVPEEREQDKDKDEEVYKTLIKNVQHHLAYISRRAKQQK